MGSLLSELQFKDVYILKKKMYDKHYTGTAYAAAHSNCCIIDIRPLIRRLGTSKPTSTGHVPVYHTGNTYKTSADLCGPRLPHVRQEPHSNTAGIRGTLLFARTLYQALVCITPVHTICTMSYTVGTPQ